MSDSGRAVARTGAPSIKSALVAKWRMIPRRSAPTPFSVVGSAVLDGEMVVLAGTILAGVGIMQIGVARGMGSYLALAATISAS